MADPLSIIASLLGVATAAIQSTRSLKEAAGRYKTRDATLRRLIEEAGDTENILNALKQLLEAATPDTLLSCGASMTTLLFGPIERCTDVCNKFREAMDQFSRKSKTTVLDWAKMEFMRGDINQFLETVAAYKATISVGLGVLTMGTVRLSHEALEQYEELVKNTIYDLQLGLQRIDDKLQNLTAASGPDSSHQDVDLSDERQVTEQCLRICQDAQSYFESLAQRDAHLLQGASQDSSADYMQEKFAAQLLTRQAFDENQASFVKIITSLRERLESVVTDGNPSERSRLQQDIQASKQCLEVCKLASSEVSNQKVHIIGEVVADGESDHVVVTTLADMFNVGKTMSKNKSSLLVGSMSDEALIKLSHDRYNSRFGANNIHDRVTTTATPDVDLDTPKASARPKPKNRQSTNESVPASSNETRKRYPNSG